MRARVEIVVQVGNMAFALVDGVWFVGRATR